jgi:hypothetical protein
MDFQERAYLGSVSLQQLIEEFRRSRTRNEERMTIQKHRGYLRENMKSLGHEARSSGILKLMWMNMLGYDTEFALVECMNSLFLDNFKLKTIGYLGLTMFLSRKSEVLLMVTNRLRLDLENRSNDFVVSSALKTFSEIADDHMAQELFPILKTLLEHESKYVRKKVCLALKRVLLQKPELTLELKPCFVSMMRENNNGLLLCTLHLAREIMRRRPQEFHSIFCDAQAHLLGKLRQTSAKSSGNYLINGINDPFLQGELVGFLLEFLSLPQTKALDQFEDMVSEFGSCLLSVYREIQDFGGSTARAMFYQIARAIMKIPYSAIALKKVGIAILGSFLGLKNRNYLFVSLKMLCLISQKYSSEVSRHNSLIMKCVNDKDFSIKRLALEILLRTTDAENLREVCQLFFKELRKESHSRKAQEMANQCFELIQRAAGSRLEMVDLTFELFQSLHDEVKLTTETLLPLFYVISTGEQTQLYSCLRALHILGNPVNRQKRTMLFAGCWVLGEFGESVVLGQDVKTGTRFSKVTWLKMLSVLLHVEIPREQRDIEVSMFVLTSFLKIFQKTSDIKAKQLIIDWFILNARKEMDAVAQKCRQYLRLMRLPASDLEEILETWEFNTEKVDKRLTGLGEGAVDVETLDVFATRINTGDFVQTDSKPGLLRAQVSEEHVLGEGRKPEKEDMQLMELEENNGLQNEGDEMEVIDLLQMDFDGGVAQGGVNEGAVHVQVQNNEPEVDLLIDNQNDINLLGDDFDLGNTATQTEVQVQAKDDNDFLGMMGAQPKKNKRDKLSDNIDEMLNLEMTTAKDTGGEDTQIKKKRGLGKPKSNLKKPSKKVEEKPKQENWDLDLLGKDDPQPQVNSNQNFDLLDDLDFMGGGGQLTTDTQTQNEYAALDELDDVLIRGNEDASVAKPEDNTMDLLGMQTDSNVPVEVPKESTESKGQNKDYDCLDLGENSESLLTGRTLQNGNNFASQQNEQDDFEDDEFEDCEMAPETPIQSFKTLFENNEILLEHSTRQSGLNVYHIENCFTNRTGQPLTGLRLNIQVQKHVKTRSNRLSSAVLNPNASRGATQTLELEDHSGFAKPLKIKMILKYTLMGIERVHKFIGNNFV